MPTRAVWAAVAAAALATTAGCSGGSHHKQAAETTTSPGQASSTTAGLTPSTGVTTTTVPATLSATGPPIPPPAGSGSAAAVAPAGSVALGTKPRRIVLSWPQAYVLGEASAGRFDVARVDLPGRTVAARATLAGTAVGGAVSGDGLYVAAAAPSGVGATLYRLDPSSLAVQTQVALPGRGSAVVARTDGVYVASGPALERLDPQSLALRTSVPVPAHDDAPDLAADPRTTILWIALPAQDPPLTVAEVDLGALRVLRTRRDLGGVHGGSVSGILDGAWVGYPTGTESTAVRLRSSDGATAATFQAPMPNRAAYTVSGTRLWFSGGTAAGLGCADLATGAVGGTSDVASDSAPLAADTHAVLLGDAAGGAVRLLVPAAACR